MSGSEIRQTLSPLEPLVDAIEHASFLDAPGEAIGRQVRDAIPAGAVKDAISGTWLGHALHPLLTDLVIGSFTSASVLDLIGGRDGEAAARRLIGVGIAAYLPTALTGVSDWADGEPADDGVRRTGLIHAATNATALALYVASLRARRAGRLTRGRLLGGVGAAVLGLGGHLGGHLSYRQGVGVDQTFPDPGPEEWTGAGELSELPDGGSRRIVAADTPVLLLRDGERIFALHDRCSHRGCSLAEGTVEGDEVVCGCHGSRFSREDGALRAGPATAPQPAFETRVRGGRIEVRLDAASRG